MLSSGMCSVAWAGGPCCEELREGRLSWEGVLHGCVAMASVFLPESSEPQGAPGRPQSETLRPSPHRPHSLMAVLCPPSLRELFSPHLSERQNLALPDGGSAVFLHISQSEGEVPAPAPP